MQIKAAAHFHGLAIIFALAPGADAPGSMRAPAPQAKRTFPTKHVHGNSYQHA